MAGQLSPDGQYYWDGAQWASAVSPDGAWRWDGTSWRSGSNPPAMRARVATLIASGVLASLLIAGLGVAAGTRLLTSERAAVQTSAAPSCTGTAALPGSQLSEGELVCGRTLGVRYLAADCTASSSVPPEIDAEQIAGAGADWTAADVGPDAGGCELAAKPDQIVEVDSKGLESPEIVLVADFVPVDRAGGVGMRVACIQTASCIDIGLYADDSYSLDEGQTGSNNWKNISEGPLVLARLRFGEPNRLILRYALGAVYVFLNGVEVTHGTPTFAQLSGYVGFYINDQQSSLSERAQLRRLYAFGS